VDREVLQALVDDGASIREIAERLGRSPTNVRHWLRRHGLTTRRTSTRAAMRAARERGDRELVLTCRVHGVTTFRWRASDGSFRCMRCRAEAVLRRRRRVKAILVEEAGGACRLCGYAKCVAALEFHHLDPATKSFGLAVAGVTRRIGKMRAEAAKCVLLCSNCHAEVEAGLVKLPGWDSNPQPTD
jgi:transposase-like protein